MTLSLLFDSRESLASPRLLVSLSTAADAEAAIVGGADLLDVKDPSRGSLGRATASTLREIVEVIAGRGPITAAWGELPQSHPLTSGEVAALRGVDLIKIGTAECQNLPNWRTRWQHLYGSLPKGLRLAVVHYADWRSCAGLDFADCLLLARSMPGSPLVFDTFDKSRGDILRHYSQEVLRAQLDELYQCDLRGVVAGSLKLWHLPVVLACRPAIVAVRGAACEEGNRLMPVCSQRVATLRAAMINGATEGQNAPPRGVGG
jgi:(5-formylfuran-3-yl)methyl phosphate synthase